MKSNTIKRALAIALAVMMIAGVSAASVFAVGVAPAPPYFFMDADFTQVPRMGNATINDVEYDSVGDVYILFLQPERWTNPYDNHDYIGELDEFGVYDSGGVYHDDVMDGGTVKLPGSYIQENTEGEPYFAVHIGVELYDLTDKKPAPHQDWDVFLSVDALYPASN